MNRSMPWGIVCGVSLLAQLGCTGGSGAEDRPATVPVQGKVLLDGEPVEGASVVFSADVERTPGQPPGGKSAFGKTQSDGTFKLTTFETNDGAVPGKYFISVKKMEKSEQAEVLPESDPNYDPSAGTEPVPPPKNLLPEKYSNPRKSGLNETVTEAGPNDFTIELTE